MDGLWVRELRVDFGPLHGGFVGHGGTVAQGRVQPDRVVPALDVAEAGQPIDACVDRPGTRAGGGSAARLPEPKTSLATALGPDATEVYWLPWSP